MREHIPGAKAIANLHRLPAGASQETWAIDVETEDGALPLILRRGVHGNNRSGSGSTTVLLSTEAELATIAETAGVPVPRVRYVLQPEDGVGSGFIMDFVEGETIARKILRDAEYAEVRPKLARQCGEVAARIHAISARALPELPESPGAVQMADYKARYEEYDYPHPVFEFGFQWLEARLPEKAPLGLVHGDFRNGNFIIGPDRVRAVLDWELAHLGDPMEDLGWICVNSWRHGNIDNPVGGFGTREDLFEGYESAGGQAVDAARVRFWEVFGSLK